MITMSILGLLCVSDVIENDRFSRAREFLVYGIRNVKTGRFSNLDPAERSFYMSRLVWRHSLFVQTAGRLLPSAGPSAITVNAEKSVRPELANKPDSRGLPLGDLRDSGAHLHRPEHDQQVEATPASQTKIVIVPQCY